MSDQPPSGFSASSPAAGAAQAPVATILLVDDDPNVTRSLVRALRQQPYELLVAHDAAGALQHLQGRAVDLAVCDLRLPGDDGIALLSTLQARWPDCVRILLTGQADLDATIQAINEGRIHRYVAKPWDNAEFCQVLAQSLAHRQVDLERRQLLAVVQQQNEALQQANSLLEERVRERTAELQLANEQLDDANNELQRSYVMATEVFSALLNQRLPPDRQSNRDVIELATTYAELSDLPQKDRRDLTMAAALYNLDKLTWSDDMLALSPDVMTRDQRQRYRDYPARSQHLLMALEPAQDAAAIIRHHQECWDGSGFPDRLEGEAIPLGARILKLIVDFVEWQMGVASQRRLKPEEFLRALPGHAGQRYDPFLIDPLVAAINTLAEAHGEQEPDIVRLGTHQLRPGMTLVRKLHSNRGLLLLGEGKVLTRTLIEKLLRFEANEGAHYQLLVRLPETREHDAS